MSTLKTLQQQIDNLTKLKICGYIREYEQNNNKDKIIIPIMIQYIIMLYYWINEKFSKHGKSLQLNGNSKLATVKCRKVPFVDKIGWWYEYNTVYGDSIIINDESIAKYKWSIKYSSNNDNNIAGDDFNLGIASDCRSADRVFSCDIIDTEKIDKYTKYQFYSLWNTERYWNGGCKKGLAPFRKKGVIHLSLDMKQHKLSFSLDTDPTEYNIYERIDMDNYKYRLAISMYLKQGNECELINFKIFHH